MLKYFKTFLAQGLPPDDIYGVRVEVGRFASNGKLGDEDGTELESISGKNKHFPDSGFRVPGQFPGKIVSNYTDP
jgi:hypothetical protein